MESARDDTASSGHIDSSERWFHPAELLTAGICFGLAFATYVCTLAPTVTFGDSGELITAAYTLGIAHPPGYPIWTLLGKLFTYLPVGSIAYRVNLMSAFFSALSIGLMALLLCRDSEQLLCRSPSSGSWASAHPKLLALTCAASVSLCLAFTPLLWSHSVEAEVYSLNFFFVAASLLCLSLWATRRDRTNLLYLASFLVGLGLTNHLTLMLILPGYVFYYFVVGRKEPRLLRNTLIAASWSLLGFAFYAYILLRARMDPPVNWGGAETLGGFLRHVTRYNYRTLEPLKPLSFYLTELQIYGGEQISQFSYLLGAAVLVLLAYRKVDAEKRRWLVFTLLTFLCFNILLLITLTSSKTGLSARITNTVFFLPSSLFLSMWIFWGLMFLVRTVAPRLISILGGRITSLGLSAAMISLPAAFLASNFRDCNMRGNDFGYVFGKEFLGGMPEGAIFFAGTEASSFIPLYLKHVDNFRPDIKVIYIGRLLEETYLKQLTSRLGDVHMPSEKDYVEAYGMYRRMAAPVARSGLLSSGRSGPGKGAVDTWIKSMKVNGILAGMIFQRNKDKYPFYYDEGLPVMWMRDYMLPSGLISKLCTQRVTTLAPDDEAVQKDLQYWERLETMLMTDPRFLRDLTAQRLISKRRSNAANVYLHHGLYSLAETAFHQAIRFSETHAEAYTGLARLYVQQGEHQKALTVFSRYLQIDPYSMEARQFFEWLKSQSRRPRRRQVQSRIPGY